MNDMILSLRGEEITSKEGRNAVNSKHPTKALPKKLRVSRMLVLSAVRRGYVKRAQLPCG